jgi:hypothetical protein
MHVDKDRDKDSGIDGNNDCNNDCDNDRDNDCGKDGRHGNARASNPAMMRMVCTFSSSFWYGRV